MARLVVLEGSLASREYRIDPGLTLGRETHNDVAMPTNRHASRDHAKVWKDGAASWAIADLGSTNGTLVNDAKITRQPLTDGDLIRIGEVLLRFELEDEDRPQKVAKKEKPPDLGAVLRGEVSPRPQQGQTAPGETADSIRIKERVLQYHKKSAKGAPTGYDLGQMAGWKKWVMILVALGIAVGIFLLAKGFAETTRTP